MTYYYSGYTELPDPDTDSAFYESVPSRRLLAWFLDAGFTFAITVLISTLTLGIGFFLFGFVWLVSGLIYRIMTISSGSATWGMRLVGIEFRSKDGQKFSTGLAIAHTLMYTFAVGTTILQLLSIVLILSTRYKQSLPDMILGTTAINRPAN